MAVTNDKKLMTYNTTLYFWTKLKNYFAKRVHTHTSASISDSVSSIDKAAPAKRLVTDQAVVDYVEAQKPPAATGTVAGLVKVDTGLNGSSSNPVQNKAVATEIRELSTGLQANDKGDMRHHTARFGGFAEGDIEVRQMSLGGGVDCADVLFSPVRGTFVRRKGGDYYNWWMGAESYLAPDTMKPHPDKLYLYSDEVYICCCGGLSKVGGDLRTSLTELENQVATNTNAIAGITGFDFRIVDRLPANGEKGTVYLVPMSDTSDGNAYREYIWIEEAGDNAVTRRFELIGTLGDVNLGDCWKKTELAAMTNSEIDTIMNS